MARALAWASIALAAGAAVAGCRLRAGADPDDGRIDPGDPMRGPACPAGEPHLAVGLDTREYGAVPALLRYTARLTPCAGVRLEGDYRETLTAVAGTAGGSEVVGFAGGYGANGILVRLDGDREVARIGDADRHPRTIAAVTFGGQPALAVLWTAGTPFGSTQDAIAVVHAQDDLSVIAEWPVSFGVSAIGAPLGEPGARLSAIVQGDGLQDYRADRGADSLATTGELRIAMPFAGLVHGVDVAGDRVRVAADDGVLAWTRGGAPAFLGPVQCRWPGVVGSPLPVEDASYSAALVDEADPERSIVIVDGALEGDDRSLTHLFVHRDRGECEHLATIERSHSAVAIGWVGR